jgi:hypothetical protein
MDLSAFRGNCPPDLLNTPEKELTVRRRDFLAVGGAGLLVAIAPARRQLGAATAGPFREGLAWQRHGQSGLFEQVTANGQPLARGKQAGLLDGFCRPSGKAAGGADSVVTAATPAGQCGPVRLGLTHRLLASDGGQKLDLLEASLTVRNSSDRAETIEVGFRSAARPCNRAADQQIYVPLSIGRSLASRFEELGGPQWRLDCRQPVGADGFLGHYLEPLASDPRHTATVAMLLAPVVDIFHPQQPWRVALFGTSLEPTYFQAVVGDGTGLWQMGRTLRLDPHQERTIRGYLHVHRGDAAEAWTAFHRFGHHEDFPAVDWLRRTRVHYFDFLSAADPNGRRGDGYDADLKRFGDFHVGLATQHGYYPAIGDYLHPDRKRWQAMLSDPRGAATMSLEKMKARVQATRGAGAHPAVYLHMCLFDEGTPLYDRLKDSIVVGPSGKPMNFEWQGPDTVKRTWKMSVASAAWRDHLLKQAQWIMELFDPDAIVMDETFAALGYDHHPQRRGPLSSGGIELVRKMRALVRSFGPNKAFLVSDCSISNMGLWADGEAADHAYDAFLGNPLYRQSPVRHLAVLGDKPWRPCAWNFQKFWPQQIELARAVGAGVGVSNGWLEFTGLTRLPEAVRQQMIHDIESLPAQ